METAAKWRLVLPITSIRLGEASLEPLLVNESTRELNPMRLDLQRPTTTPSRLKHFGLGRAAPNLLTTAPPLELGPEFGAHAWMALLETSLAEPSHTTQGALRASAHRAPRTTILSRSNSRFDVPRRAPLALR